MYGPASSVDEEAQLIQDIAQFTHDPYGYALYSFPWGQPNTEFENSTGPRAWQAALMQELGDHLRNPESRFMPFQFAVSSGHGIGKAQNNDAIIDTPEGRKRWGDLNIGDVLFADDGSITEIVDIPYRGVRPFYRVTFDDGSSCITGQEHLWQVRGRNDRRTGTYAWQTLETQQILEQGVKRKNGENLARQWEIPVQGAAQFPERSVPIDPYTMGVWLGDGCSTSAQICCPDDAVRVACGGNDYHANGASFRVPGLQVALKQNDYLVESSDQKFIADCYLYNSIDVRKALLAGLLDTDADCSAGYSVEFASTSKALADGVLWLARSLGYKARISGLRQSSYKDSAGLKVECKPHYRVRITSHENPFRLPRKADLWRKPKEDRYLSRWIESIEFVGNLEGQCVTVANENGLYLANDFIVTHNSSCVGMLIKWALDTCEDCRVVITANTEGQLRTKTAPEVNKWARTAITEHWFHNTATAIYTKQPKHDKNWRADFTPWSKDNTEAFAGLHNQGKRILLVFDEASAIHDRVWEVAEGALTDENTEIIWLAFGNPTRATGRFRECFRKYSKNWYTMKIDSRDVEGTNKAKLKQWEETYGENSDWFRVRVRGEFPNVSAYQFYSTAIIEEAQTRQYSKQQYEFAPVILSCDPAWTGADEMVIAYRQGNYFKVLWTVGKNDNDVQVANQLMRFEDQYKADAVFIDQGYGTGIYSVGHTNGRTWQLVPFGGKSNREDCVNKRAEMLVEVGEWLKQGGAIDPADTDLIEELTALEAMPTLDGKFKFPPKDDMKEILGRSPNRLDALGLTFAQPVFKNTQGVLANAKDTKPYNPSLRYRSR